MLKKTSSKKLKNVDLELRYCVLKIFDTFTLKHDISDCIADKKYLVSDLEPQECVLSCYIGVCFRKPYKIVQENGLNENHYFSPYLHGKFHMAAQSMSAKSKILSSKMLKNIKKLHADEKRRSLKLIWSENLNFQDIIRSIFD